MLTQTKKLKLKIWLLLPLIFISTAAFSQKKFTISGFIKDSQTGEELLGATVYVPELKTGVSTNLYGFYSLTIPEGKYKLVYSFIGYQPITKEIDLKENFKFNIELGPNSEILKEVVVEGKKEDKNVKDVQMSVEKLSMESIKKIPQLLGEADVIKSMQLRPGVSSVGEGASGFNVRGGNIDQNLILLDESPVYNSSHLFGFFSVFNPDAIKDAQLYKGGIPALYGGRLSSVMDVRQREGNMRQFKGKGGIGLLFSRLTLEGPIVKDKVSFLVSGRRSYADLFLKLNKEYKENSAYFYDLNTKVNWKINDKNRIFLSGYFGRDVFAFGDQFRMSWGNATVSARWNKIISDKLFSNVTAVYSDYSYKLGVPSGANAFEWTSQILNYNGKADFTYYLNANNTIKFGINSLYYKFKPGRAEGKSETFNQVIEVQHEQASENAIYVSNEQKLGSRFTLKYGLRYSHFFNIGPYKKNIYKFDKPTIDGDIIGKKEYSSNKVIADYGGLEPRLAVNYAVSEKSSIKASYQRTRQYLHLVSNTTAATPIDVWKPAGAFVKPAISDQVAIGYFENFKGNTYEFSGEVYYKDMQNLLDYRNGADLLLNENLENQLLQGKGRSYGLELMMKKSKGKFTGWVSYTLSKTESKVEGFVAGDYFGAETGINDGEWYNANWDKTHDISVVGTYEFSKKLSFSANFIFMTGRPATYPDGIGSYDNKAYPIYKSRNKFRTPNTHRLDLSVTYTPPRLNKKWKHSFVFGLYNAYGRKNPYSVFFTGEEDNNNRSQAYKLSIIGIPVPAITYNFNF